MHSSLIGEVQVLLLWRVLALSFWRCSRHSTCGLQGVTEEPRESHSATRHTQGRSPCPTEDVPARRESTELSEPDTKPPRSAQDMKYLSMLERLDEGGLVRAEDGG